MRTVDSGLAVTGIRTGMGSAWRGLLKSTFDVGKHIEPKHIVKVMKEHPELFSDLPPIPASVAIGPGFVFKP